MIGDSFILSLSFDKLFAFEHAIKQKMINIEEIVRKIFFFIKSSLDFILAIQRMTLKKFVGRFTLLTISGAVHHQPNNCLNGGSA